MPTEEDQKQQKAQRKHQREELNASVRQQVLRALGAPGDLRQTQVRHLWDHCYRVNVFVGAEPNTARIAHSYFVLVDGEGSVIECRPKLTKQY
jgi:hypothetical protein